MVNPEFRGELETLFRTNFLQAAPLYQASGKFKLPYEDIKTSTTLYRGSLSEQTRTVETYADWFQFDDERPYTPDHARGVIMRMGKEAGICVDGLIRLENVRNHRDHDPRNTTDMKVVDIFDHADGRRNLQIILSDPSPSDPGTDLQPWVGYRFYFAAASVSSEYKRPV